MWDIKGEEFLKKLAQQELFLVAGFAASSADALAKAEKLAVAFGLGRVPAQSVCRRRFAAQAGAGAQEGLPALNGFGAVLGVIKKPPHPNATGKFSSTGFLVKRDRTCII